MIFMGISNIKIFDNTLFHLEEIENTYINYMETFKQLSLKKQNAFLTTLETQEIVSTQSMEIQNSFLAQLYNNIQDENPIDYLCEMFKKDITLEQIDKLHSILICGTPADQEKNARFRNGDYASDYNKWVGYMENGNRVIQYIPPDPKEVMEQMKSIVYFINNNKERSLLFNIFIKSFIFHFEIAALQPFGDGNTRTARLLQSGNIWKETNQCLCQTLEKPILYASHRYKVYAGTYRNYIKQVVVEKDNEAWNRWFNFNLNMFDEVLYKYNNDIKYLLKAK